MEFKGHHSQELKCAHGGEPGDEGIYSISLLHTCMYIAWCTSQTHNSEVGEFTSVYLQRLREAAE